HDGEAAIVAASDFRPDVVLLDIGLPGIDGYETARRLRASPGFAATQLVALTGYGQTGDRTKASQAAFALPLAKPIRADLLHRLLSSRLHSLPRATGSKFRRGNRIRGRKLRACRPALIRSGSGRARRVGCLTRRKSPAPWEAGNHFSFRARSATIWNCGPSVQSSCFPIGGRTSGGGCPLGGGHMSARHRHLARSFQMTSILSKPPRLCEKRARSFAHCWPVSLESPRF